MAENIPFEERFALWQQSYQQYRKLLIEYYHLRERFQHQLALYTQELGLYTKERQHLQGMRELLEQEKREPAFPRTPQASDGSGMRNP